eukprot:12901742-Alexandrium_andersonii.AAC.1
MPLQAVSSLVSQSVRTFRLSSVRANTSALRSQTTLARNRPTHPSVRGPLAKVTVSVRGESCSHFVRAPFAAQ